MSVRTKRGRDPNYLTSSPPLDVGADHQLPAPSEENAYQRWVNGIISAERDLGLVF